MHITITGKLGSGKSTICKLLSARYGFPLYSTGAIQREIAHTHNISTLEMNNLMAKDLSFDHAIDDAVRRISIERESETIIFDSRMAWHFAVNSFRVFVDVDPVVAATRIINDPRGEVEVYSDLEDAKTQLMERAKLEKERFIEIYGVDYSDRSNYDLVVDSTDSPPEALADLVYEKFVEFSCEPRCD